jgi:hypothetical protein
MNCKLAVPSTFDVWIGSENVSLAESFSSVLKIVTFIYTLR